MENDENNSDEEVLVFAEFDETVNLGKYRSIHVLGVNSKKPVVQLDETFFTGNYETPVGTLMFFEEDSAPQCLDPLFDKLPEKNLKYIGKTQKYIKMEHAYVTAKEEKDVPMNSKSTITDTEDIEIPNYTNLEEAIKQLRREWKPSELDIKEDVESMMNSLKNLSGMYLLSPQTASRSK